MIGIGATSEYTAAESEFLALKGLTDTMVLNGLRRDSRPRWSPASARRMLSICRSRSHSMHNRARPFTEKQSDMGIILQQGRGSPRLRSQVNIAASNRHHT